MIRRRCAERTPEEAAIGDSGWPHAAGAGPHRSAINAVGEVQICRTCWFLGCCSRRPRRAMPPVSVRQRRAGRSPWDSGDWLPRPPKSSPPLMAALVTPGLCCAIPRRPAADSHDPEPSAVAAAGAAMGPGPGGSIPGHDAGSDQRHRHRAGVAGNGRRTHRPGGRTRSGSRRDRPVPERAAATQQPQQVAPDPTAAWRAQLDTWCLIRSPRRSSTPTPVRLAVGAPLGGSTCTRGGKPQWSPDQAPGELRGFAAQPVDSGEGPGDRALEEPPAP